MDATAPTHVCGQAYDQRLVIQDAHDGFVYERVLRGGARACPELGEGAELGEAALVYGVLLSLDRA